MTKEEIIQAITEDKTMPFIQPEQLAGIVDFVIKNYKPSLPSNLDEAAEEYAYTNWEDNDYHEGASEGLPFDAIGHTEKCFKAGAEWMEGQGVNADFGVCKLANRAWLTAIDEKRFMQDVFGNFAAGDKVVVQIRKK